MKQIRTGVFETNSSLTHSIVMCPTNEYNKWVDEESILFNQYLNPMFMPIEEARKYNGEVMKTWREKMKSDDFMYEYDDDLIEFLSDENIEKYVNGDIGFDEFEFDHYAVVEEMYYNFDYWEDSVCEYRETFTSNYEQNGEKVTAFGYYGHD